MLLFVDLLLFGDTVPRRRKRAVYVIPFRISNQGSLSKIHEESK